MNLPPDPNNIPLTDEEISAGQCLNPLPPEYHKPMTPPHDPNKPTLSDLSPMPFGKYKGRPMQDVPADYLHWLWCNGKSGDRLCPVANYIRENLTILESENSDLIW